MRPTDVTIRHAACFSVGLLIASFTCGVGQAKPLDAEACAQLKAQREAIAATGAGDLVRGRPPANRADISGERAKQVRTLINLDGQLRFRCGMDLLLPTLKPDPVEEFVDAGDTAGSGRPSPRTPVAKKAKTVKATPSSAAQPAGAPAAEGTPAPAAPRSAAAIKTGSTPEQAEPAAPKSVAKQRSKPEDAYRGPPGGNPNGTSLDKQVPKPQ